MDAFPPGLLSRADRCGPLSTKKTSAAGCCCDDYLDVHASEPASERPVLELAPYNVVTTSIEPRVAPCSQYRPARDFRPSCADYADESKNPGGCEALSRPEPHSLHGVSQLTATHDSDVAFWPFLTSDVRSQAAAR